MTHAIQRPVFLAKLLFLLVAVQPSNAESTPGDVVGKVTIGYQGWFWIPGDGSPWAEKRNASFHFRMESGHEDDADYHTIEMWPDTRDYATTFAASYENLGSGKAARMFSSYTDETVQMHLRWMKEADIDTVALQRFGSELTEPAIKETRDAISTKVMRAAEAQGRKFYVMYDCSGWLNFQSTAKTDWKDTILGTLHLTSSPAYAHQNGKPVVCLWGIGYARSESVGPYDAATSLEVVNWFKSQGCYVIGGVPGQWRRGTGDSRPDFEKVYAALDMISPWVVGGVPDADSLEKDVALARKWGVDYQPNLYPGTSFFWGNRSKKNFLARNGGEFMWNYFVNLRKLGLRTCYVAMFDEVDEASAIFKVAEDASMQPTNQWFLSLDADGIHCSSDFYLRLVKDGHSMINGKLPLLSLPPTLYVAPHSGPIGDGTYELQPVEDAGRRLEASANATAGEPKIFVAERGSRIRQAVQIFQLGGDFYRLAFCSTPGRSLHVGDETDDGFVIKLAPTKDEEAQRWRGVDVGGGMYEFAPALALNQRLDTNERGGLQAGAVRTFPASGAEAQRWKLIPTIVSGAVYQFAPQTSSSQRLSIAVGSQETLKSVKLSPGRMTGQSWKITSNGKNCFEIRAVLSDALLRVSAGSDNNPSSIIATPGAADETSRWRVMDVGGGFYELAPESATHLRIEAEPTPGKPDLMQLFLRNCNGSTMQRWRLILQEG